MADLQPPKPSPEAIALWRKRRGVRLQNDRGGITAEAIAKELQDLSESKQTQLFGKIVRTSGAGGTCLVALNKPWKGLKEIPATAIAGCTSHQRVAVLRGEDGQWYALGRSREKGIRSAEISRGRPTLIPSDFYKIKYVYLAEDSLWVGGHQEEAIEVGMPSEDFGEIIAAYIDNLGVDEFTLDVKGVDAIARYDGGWTVTPLKTVIGFGGLERGNAFWYTWKGHGFWTRNRLVSLEDIDIAQGTDTTNGGTQAGEIREYQRSDYVFNNTEVLGSVYLFELEIWSDVSNSGQNRTVTTSLTAYNWLLPDLYEQTLSASGVETFISNTKVSSSSTSNNVFEDTNSSAINISADSFYHYRSILVSSVDDTNQITQSFEIQNGGLRQNGVNQTTNVSQFGQLVERVFGSQNFGESEVYAKILFEEDDDPINTAITTGAETADFVVRVFAAAPDFETTEEETYPAYLPHVPDGFDIFSYSYHPD